MKKLFLFLCLVAFTSIGNSQLKGILDRAKQKAANKATEKVDKSIDKTTDPSSGKTDTPGNEAEKKSSENNGTTTTKQTADTTKKETTAPASIKAYSKYDFVPGEKIVSLEDFSTGSVGDLPAGWNTNGSAEIVTIEGKPGRWLWLSKPGAFLPELTKSYPEDFTFEFDLLHGTPFSGTSLDLVIAEMQNTDNLQGWNTSPQTFKAGFYITSSAQKEGAAYTEIRKNSTTQSANQVGTELMSDKYNPVHISIWRQKERVRIYANQEKLWDIPKAIATEAKLNALFFSIVYADADSKQYIGNLRLAVGAPDTRKKFLEQSKWVTHGILFDVNRDNIKPESYGTLKEMANVLKEYTDLKVKIVGHTDGDGNDVGNLDLSKRRAASVKTSLAKEFGIDESRMETDGKGESEPIDKNDNPAGKANNRRVEFIKL